jgi:hypothetical protein
MISAAPPGRFESDELWPGQIISSSYQLDMYYICTAQIDRLIYLVAHAPTMESTLRTYWILEPYGA